MAVVDSGIYPAHGDLAPRLWTNPGEPPVANNIDEDTCGCRDDFHFQHDLRNTGTLLRTAVFPSPC